VPLDGFTGLATRPWMKRSSWPPASAVADANVTRPTLYRRWKNKLDLVVDALDYGFRKQGDMYTVDLSQLDGREALAEAVRRVDPPQARPFKAE
jgi:hypothetical protein